MTITQEFLAQAQSLKQLYDFVRPTEVEAYLEEYPFLVSLLHTAPAKIHEYFSDAPLQLEVVTYHDGPEGDRDMFVNILLGQLESEEASSALYELDESWWDTISQLAQDKLELTVAYS